MKSVMFTGMLNIPSQKDLTFTVLYTECRLAVPGAHLTYTIRNRLAKLSKEERKEIVSRVKEGCAPLFLACQRGNVEIVEYLITQCNSDVEQRGIYEVPDDGSIHYVTPLWCASVAGNLGVVKCLVEHGADVNSVSDTGSTSVRSACFMTHYEVVVYLVANNANILQANYNGGTCLINSVQCVPLCEFLLKHGADVNAHDIKLKTALHYAIQEHRIETVKLLLEYGADRLKKNIYGDDALQTACLKGASLIVEYFCKNYDYPSERIAEAYELLGSTYLDEYHDVQTAVYYWRTALKIRYDDDDDRKEKKQIASKPAYLNAVEFQTLEELDNIALDLDAMKIQSLLICERILGPLHRDTVLRLVYRGAVYADNLQYQRAIDLWLYALELRIQRDGLLHSEVCSSAQALIHLFLDFYKKHNTGILRQRIQYCDVYDCIKLLIKHFEPSMELLQIRPVFKSHQDNFDKLLKVLTHLIYVLHHIPKTPEQCDNLRKLVNEILHIHPCNSSGDTLLHLVVSRSNTLNTSALFEDPHTAIFPDINVAELLIECGANIEATNTRHGTPLHVAAHRLNFDQPIVEMLLRHGAHIDRRNRNGERAHLMLQALSDSTINHLHHMTLKCLAACKIIENQIGYVGKVPVILENFISIH